MINRRRAFVAVASVVGCSAASCWTPTIAQGNSQGSETVSAHEFVITDPSGRALLRLGSEAVPGQTGAYRATISFADGPVKITSESVYGRSMIILDRQGRWTGSFGLRPTGAGDQTYFHLASPTGAIQASVVLGPGESIVPHLPDELLEALRK